MIAEIENAIIGRIKELSGNTLDTVETVPANFDIAEISARPRRAPAVYVAFLGGTPRSNDDLVVDGNFALYVLQEVGNEEQRRRGVTKIVDGEPVRIGGAYSVLELIVPEIHNMTVPEAGSLGCTGIYNLFSDELDRKGVSLYSATFSIPMPLPRRTSEDVAGIFATFHADWTPQPGPVPAEGPIPLEDGVPIASDHVTLPQE